MEEAQREIKDNLYKFLGEVTFENYTMRILSQDMGLSEVYIRDINRQLPAFQDMSAIRIEIDRPLPGKQKLLEYKITFHPPELFPAAMHHLRKITHGFVKANSHYHRH